jgi:hypothetical protein
VCVDRVLVCRYYGHVHNAIVYNAMAGTKTLFRCAGHGAVPYSATKDLADVTGTTVEWYESQSANDARMPVRVLNGYVAVTLDGAQLTEVFISELGEERFRLPAHEE